VGWHAGWIASGRGQVIDERVLKALGHPLRMRLLAMLDERVASPKELADELGEPLGNVAYHVRTLLDLGCVELVRTTPRRGAVEHHYRALVPPVPNASEWGRIPASLRGTVAGSVVGRVWRDLRAAVRKRGFSPDDAHASRTTLVLDGQGWKDLRAALQELNERAAAIEGESRKRLGEREGAHGAELATVLFEWPAALRESPPGAEAS
jgi:DNA-binding transcriptional ArsR family regulator